MQNKSLDRIRDEVRILEREAGRPVSLGNITDDQGTKRIGVLIRDVPVPPQLWGNVKAVKMLLLLPDQYPKVPPLGLYVDRPYEAESDHFIHRPAHGAPSLVGRGWYWWCWAVGGFGKNEHVWRPAGNPKDGHNLATVFWAGRVLMSRG